MIRFKQFKELIPIGKTFFYDIKKTVDVNKVYRMFKTNQLTTKEKHHILFKSENLTNSQKETLWKRYMEVTR